ncbi:class I SAM-dependent methyltransferase [Candidatus Woesearchaeota archaeon]|nr:class I SAM-dependent methyltransferase [Candidatus Woesearchaeota archaeon]
MIRLEQGRHFGKISNLYDKARISYPLQLVEDILSYSKIDKLARILDVGCGTGHATILFARRNYEVIGLDISQQMIQVAQEKCYLFPKVSFMVGIFEGLQLPDASIDLIISGMAWHWITPEGREKKANRILKPGGTLALFWYYQRKQESPFVTAVGSILDKYDGVDRGPAGSRVKQISEELFHQLKTNYFFTSIMLKEYNAEIEFTREKYLDLVLSYGWVQSLPIEKRNLLVAELKQLNGKFKDSLMIPYNYVLLLAKTC